MNAEKNYTSFTAGRHEDTYNIDISDHLDLDLGHIIYTKR